MRSSLLVRWLGSVPYREALALQESLVAAARRGEATDQLLLLEHPEVITLGRSADPANVLISAEERVRRGIEIHESGRGGDVTYHGPGQLVGYPIVALREEWRDARRYLRELEEALILAVADFGILAVRAPGLTGIWVGERKLAAIGVRISTGWITSHGFALNVSTDLSGFRWIVPCGIRDRGVTSMEQILGREVAILDAAARVATRLAERLSLRAVPSPAAERWLLPAVVEV